MRADVFNTRVVAIGAFAGWAVCLSFTSNAGDVLTSVDLPRSREASKDAPQCGDIHQTTAADVGAAVPQVLGDILTGIPAITGINAELHGGASNKIKSIFGTHDGPAACALMCVTIPADASVDHTDACVSDGFGTKCGLAKGNGDILPDYWGGVKGGTEKVYGKNKLVCTMAMNWAHDRDRKVTWRVTW